MQANIVSYNKLLPSVAAEYRAKGHDISVHDVNEEAQWVAEDYWIWVSDLPCNVRREGGSSLVIVGPSLVILEGKACNPL